MGECGSSQKESVPLLFSQLLGIRPFRTNKDPVPLIRIRKGRTRKPPNKKTPPLCPEDPPIPNRFHRTFFRFLDRSGGPDKFHSSTAVFPPFFGHAAVFPADERITMQ
ncbi:MAG: hypothetical protein C6P37_15590 [Caldibacillus debilis]|uniref:Uncharacterized protein n=1 Tax=Caldibacillus debilis TaxID=301148 RepID=A0A3E0JX60_9BACI|nr:MAG: hypothetical protein C6P37_15590 [Caldibacillus debilis]